MNEQNPLVFLFRMTWRFSEGNRGNVVKYWLLFMTAQSIHLFGQPLLAARMMDVIQKDGITPTSLNTLFLLLGGMMFIEFMFWVFHVPGRVLEEYNAFIVKMNYRSFLLKGFVALPIEWHTDHHSGDTIDKIEKGTNALCDFSSETCDVIYSGIRLLVSFCVLTYFSLTAACIAFVLVVCNIVITMRFDKVLVGQYRQLSRMENAIGASINDAICNIRTVIILRVERLVFKAIMHKVEAPFPLFKANTVLNEWKWFSTSQFCKGLIVISLGIYFFQNNGTKGGILVSSVYLLATYLDNLGELFFRFAQMYGMILRRAARVRNAEELSQDFTSESLTNHVLPETWRQLSIEGLNFSYPTEEEEGVHLNDISFTCQKGERIALIGSSGGGKSTFLSVIRDLYHPTQLTLVVDGNEVSQGFEGICQAISLMPQNPEIFATTIRDNITMGAEYDDDTIIRFTDMACFTDVANNLPKGFDSSVNEKGVNLSGGQQQRLALSRGLLASRDKDIVLLDEPTSSLDSENSMKIYQNIFKEFKGKTVISSVHQLHLLPLFDRVVMFDGGRIIGQGTIGCLLMNCPQFQELWEQSSISSEAKGVVL